MRVLSDTEAVEAGRFLQHAAHLALRSKCLRSRGGSVLVKDQKIIGEGWNSPPLDECIEVCLKEVLPQEFKGDKTCCVHAEQRAMIDALDYHGKTYVQNSRIYFVRLDETGTIKYAGHPNCTTCSKSALDVGIAEFVLYHQSGITVYDTREYNNITFQHASLSRTLEHA